MFLINCETKTQSQSQENIEEVTVLPQEIKEASACEISSKSDLIWTIEDQNNDNILFGFNRKGDLIKQIAITNAKNNDWEDLTSDDEGNLYIGDFGNNENDRQNLAIYKINAGDLTKDEVEKFATLQFYFPEQKDFPPKKKDKIFDVESFFFYNNAFYLFTKNRSSKFDGTTTLYKVENNTEEKVAAIKISSFVTCDDFNHCAVTSAAISPDKKKVALLSSDKVWLFTDFKNDDFFSGKSQIIELGSYTQKEGLCFDGDSAILITDEADKKTEGKLYRLNLK